MYKIMGRIEGVAPLLVNRFTEESTESLRTGATGGRKNEQQRIDEALLKVYRDAEGQICVPAKNLKKCLLEGIARARLKEGRASAVPNVQASVFFEKPDLVLNKEKPDFISEEMGRRPPKKGGACLIKRPGFHEGWQLSFTLLVLDDRRDAELLHRGMEEAGLLVGIGDHRPEYGRFIVKEWQVVK